MIRTVLKKVGIVSHGFKQVFREGVEVSRVMRSKGEHKMYSRRENELIRSHFASLRKLGVFFVMQLPPVIGLVPIALALKFPRQILTHHFFDNDPSALQSLLSEEFADRHRHAVSLLCLCARPNNAANSAGTAGVKPATLQQWHALLNSSSAVGVAVSKREYVQLLSKANMVCDSLLGATLSPSLALRFWLAMRVKEIVQDDILLLQDGLQGLSLFELQQAALRRGFAPQTDEAVLRTQLQHWLQEMVTPEDREEILQEDYLLKDYQRSKSAALLHLVAFNSTTSQMT